MIAWTPIQLDRIWRLFLPHASVLLAIFLSLLPLGQSQLALVMPLFPIMAIYFWAMAEAGTLTQAFVLFAGLLQDALSGTPLGLWALAFLAAHYFMISQRRLLAGQTFAHCWVGFSLVAVLVALLGWLIACAALTQIIPWMPFLAQAAATIILYPAIAWGLAQVQRRLPLEV